MGIGSFFGLGGSKKAGKKRAAGFREAISNINTGFDEAEGLLQPFLTEGDLANQLYLAAIGVLGPQAQADFFQNFRDSPGVEFLADRGQQGIERSAAASGRFTSGRTLADLAKFNQGIAEQSFQNRLGHLGNIGSRGFTTAGNLANLATGRASNLANLQLGKADASANAVIGAQNEKVGLTNSIAQLAGFGLGGGFDNPLQGGQPTDFKRIF